MNHDLKKIGKDAATSAAPIIFRMLKSSKTTTDENSGISAREAAEKQKRKELDKQQLKKIGKEAATAAAPIIYSMYKQKMANRKKPTDTDPRP